MALTIVPPFKQINATTITPRNTTTSIITGNTTGFSLSVGGTTSPTAQLDVISASSTTISQIIKAAASQSVDILQLQDSSANLLTTFSKIGDITLLASNQTISAPRAFVTSTGTLTLNNAISLPTFINFTPTVNYTTSPVFSAPMVGITLSPTINATTGNIGLSQFDGFVYGGTFTANGVVWTGSSQFAAFRDAPTFSVSNSGSFSSYTHQGFFSQFTISSGTIATRQSFVINDASGAGTLTNQYGLLINDLTKGTTNIALYVKGSTGHSRHIPNLNIGQDATPTENLHVHGSFSAITRTAGANISVNSTDFIIFCNFSANHSITLPTPTAGRVLIIKDISGTAQTNNINLVRSSGENIDGIAATKHLQTDWGSWIIISDGTDWFVCG